MDQGVPWLNILRSKEGQLDPTVRYYLDQLFLGSRQQYMALIPVKLRLSHVCVAAGSSMYHF